MNSRPLSPRELALTDFRAAFCQNPELTEMRLATLIMDRELVSKRLAWLTTLTQNTDGESEQDFSNEIQAIEVHGVLPAIQAGLVSFARLESLSRHPDGLRSAHAAFMRQTLAKGPPPAPGNLSSAFPNLTDMAIHPTYWAGGKSKKTYALHARDQIYGHDSGEVFINAKLPVIPYGLCRLDVHTEDGRLESIIPPLDWLEQSGSWIWTAPIVEIIGEDLASMQMYLIVPSPENRERFHRSDVEAEIQNWSASRVSSTQLKLIDRYFLHQGAP